MKNKLGAILLVLLFSSPCLVEAQVGKVKLNQSLSSFKTEPKSLPKGITIYNQEHKDSEGVSGKYYSLFDIPITAKNKSINLREVTLDYNPEKLGGFFRFIEDDVANGMRNHADKQDFIPIGAWGIGQKVIQEQKSNSFAVQNSFSGGKQAFADGAHVIQYSKDKDIILISMAFVSGSENCIPGSDVFPTSYVYSHGQQYNLLCKNPDKLNDWDSTKLMQVILEEESRLCGAIQAASGSIFSLPKKSVSDPALEKECFDKIKVMASEDKPIAWGDKLKFVYIAKDWKIVYQDAGKTIPSYRIMTVVAVSTGWDTGECRYIPVHVKQVYNGGAYSTKEYSFGGGLIPISLKKVNEFK